MSNIICKTRCNPDRVEGAILRCQMKEMTHHLANHIRGRYLLFFRHTWNESNCLCRNRVMMTFHAFHTVNRLFFSEMFLRGLTLSWVFSVGAHVKECSLCVAPYGRKRLSLSLIGVSPKKVPLLWPITVISVLFNKCVIYLPLLPFG